jgi:hypothetical protein
VGNDEHRPALVSQRRPPKNRRGPRLIIDNLVGIEVIALSSAMKAGVELRCELPGEQYCRDRGLPFACGHPGTLMKIILLPMMAAIGHTFDA